MGIKITSDISGKELERDYEEIFIRVVHYRGPEQSISRYTLIASVEEWDEIKKKLKLK